MSSNMKHERGTVSVGHCKQDNCDVYVGRGPDGRTMKETPIGERGWLGNPFTLDDHSREESVAKFAIAFKSRLKADAEFRAAVAELNGQTLGCWCQRLDEDDGDACHGEVIAHYVEQLEDD